LTALPLKKGEIKKMTLQMLKFHFSTPDLNVTAGTDRGDSKKEKNI
jgi:hypothetical protein